MPQVFNQPATLFIKLLLLAAITLIVALTAIAVWRMAPVVGLRQAIAQPIPFSHKHHVGDDGIDCRYCHTSVETSSFAGLPSSHVCLTCHSQLYRDAPMLAPLRESARSGIPIRWTRIHDLPDFVFFDHSIHVNKGIACMECHGRVDQMPLTWRNAPMEMQWCLGCHRNPDPHLHAPETVYTMTAAQQLPRTEVERLRAFYQLQSTRRLTDCSTCHR
jgi:cytochrome c7-like protein